MAQPTDVRQILDINNREDQPSRRGDNKLKDKKKRPEKVNREVFALIGDVPQMSPAIAESPSMLIKKQRNLKQKVDEWVWHQFDNPARQDGSKFCHWMKKSEVDEVYPFARFNKKIEALKYTDEEYKLAVAPLGNDWSKKETDHLFKLCERFSLKFIIIADRFQDLTDVEEQDQGKVQNEGGERKRDSKLRDKENTKNKKTQPKVVYHERTVDELKERYYSVGKAILEFRGQNDHQIVKQPFKFEQEVRRKCNLEKLFLRTKEQHEREKVLITEMKKIDQRIKKEEKEEKNLRKLIYADTDFSQPPQTVTTIVGNTMVAGEEVKDGGQNVLNEAQILDDGGHASQKGGRRDRGSGVYLRSQVLNAQLPVSENLQKKVEVVLRELKIDPINLRPTQRVAETYHEVIKEVLKMFALQKYIKKKKEELDLIAESRKEKATFQKYVQKVPQQPLPPQQYQMMPGPQGQMPQMQQPSNMPSGMQQPGGQIPIQQQARGGQMSQQVPVGIPPQQQQNMASQINVQAMNRLNPPQQAVQMQQPKTGVQVQLPPQGIPQGPPGMIQSQQQPQPLQIKEPQVSGGPPAKQARGVAQHQQPIMGSQDEDRKTPMKGQPQNLDIDQSHDSSVGASQQDQSVSSQKKKPSKARGGGAQGAADREGAGAGAPSTGGRTKRAAGNRNDSQEPINSSQPQQNINQGGSVDNVSVDGGAGPSRFGGTKKAKNQGQAGQQLATTNPGGNKRSKR